MKVAYCLSGFLRAYKNNKFVKNMVSQVPGDVFIHTWDELVPGTPLDIHEMHRIYNPLGVIVDNQAHFKEIENVGHYPVDVQNHLCLWKSIWSSINMARDYDVIIRFRPDFIVDNEMSKDEILDVFENKKTIYFGASDDCRSAGILTDNFAFGSNKVMLQYAEYYSMAAGFRMSNGSHERALSAYLESFKNDLIFKCSALRYTLRRMNGDLINTNQSSNLLSPNWTTNV